MQGDVGGWTMGVIDPDVTGVWGEKGNFCSRAVHNMALSLYTVLS